MISDPEDGTDTTDIDQEDFIFSLCESCTPYISVKTQINRLKYPCDKILVGQCYQSVVAQSMLDISFCSFSLY
jgi:hypothetical protein